MGRRLDLHAYFEFLLLGTGGEAYFQRPTEDKMKYPAIVYNRDDVDSMFADNAPYALTKRYLVTVIDYDPDSELPDKILSMPQCRFSRHFVTQGLNHDNFVLYF